MKDTLAEVRCIAALPIYMVAWVLIILHLLVDALGDWIGGPQ